MRKPVNLLGIDLGWFSRWLGLTLERWKGALRREGLRIITTAVRSNSTHCGCTNLTDLSFLSRGLAVTLSLVEVMGRLFWSFQHNQLSESDVLLREPRTDPAAKSQEVLVMTK